MILISSFIHLLIFQKKKNQIKKIGRYQHLVEKYSVIYVQMTNDDIAN